MTESGSLTFILGGARSGKSRLAESLAEEFPAPWIYVATAQAFDQEMRERIHEHRSRRGPHWQTLESPIDLETVLPELPAGRPLLLDCLTLWLTNIMLAGHDVEKASRRLAEILGNPRGPWFVVSNEVGLGIVPDNKLARQFRDAAGRLNQMVAQKANRVYFMAAGIPMTVK